MASAIGPDFLALQVKDLEASKKFYTEMLGLAVARQSPPGAVVFDTGPIPFAIRNPAVDLSASSKLGWGASLWFQVDDADALFQQLSANGVKIVMPVQDGAFGRQFMFADPDGYILTVHGRQETGH